MRVNDVGVNVPIPTHYLCNTDQLSHLFERNSQICGYILIFQCLYVHLQPIKTLSLDKFCYRHSIKK